MDPHTNQHHMLNIHTMIHDQADSLVGDRSKLHISYTALSFFEGHLVGLWMENDGHLTSLDGQGP